MTPLVSNSLSVTACRLNRWIQDLRAAATALGLHVLGSWAPLCDRGTSGEERGFGL